MYKLFHSINANRLQNVFNFNRTSHERRSAKLVQQKRQTTSSGLWSFLYLVFRSEIVESYCQFRSWIASYGFNELMNLLKPRAVPRLNAGFPYIWHFTDLNMLYSIAMYHNITWVMPCHLHFMSLLHCINIAPSRTIAFWLIFSVLCTTLHKCHPIIFFPILPTLTLHQLCSLAFIAEQFH